ncbi:hypothetical protein [Gordonia hongkongensis]|uniref:hypothetical protein n=1 Tax=Gordonia hongkongensis TaxID=1701090 RepID=UPI003D70E893
MIVAVAVLGAAGCSSDDTAGSSDHPASMHAPFGAGTTPSADAAEPDSAELDAAAVCEKIVELGVGTHCTKSEPGGLGIGATERYEFELPSVPGESGQILVFSDRKIYTKTVAAYDEAAALAGPHRYGSPNALVFVQINEGLSAAEGQKVERLVAGL